MWLLGYLNVCHFCVNYQLMIKIDHFYLVVLVFKENMENNVSVAQVSCGREKSKRQNILYLSNLCQKKNGVYV